MPWREWMMFEVMSSSEVERLSDLESNCRLAGFEISRTFENQPEMAGF